jgi:hypothetical protein
MSGGPHPMYVGGVHAGTGTEKYYRHWAREYGNTYQRRQMKDGSSWDVLKNFPEPDEVRTRLSRFGPSAELEVLDNYWLAWCRSPSSA